MLFDDVVLGNKYEDKVTGFIGVATGKAVYLYDQPFVQIEALVDNKPESKWITIGRIKPIDN